MQLIYILVCKYLYPLNINICSRPNKKGIFCCTQNVVFNCVGREQGIRDKVSECV